MRQHHDGWESVDRPLSEREMLEREYQALNGKLPADYEHRRDEILASPAVARGDREQELKREFCRAVHADRVPTALCLSGGGIRSATFNLGVIQALSEKKLLRHFDFLSTVSGGGYIGAWLSAWIHRDKHGLKGVIRRLGWRESKQGKTSNSDDHRGRDPRDVPEAGPVRHLRQYTNYLTPRLGLLRPDSATLVATYVRNLLLNWIVLLPVLAALLLLPRIYFNALNTEKIGLETAWNLRTVGQSLQLVAIVIPLLAMPGRRNKEQDELDRAGTTVDANKRDGEHPNESDDANPADRDTARRGLRTSAVIGLVIVPLIGSAILLSLLGAWIDDDIRAKLRNQSFWGNTWLWLYVTPPLVAALVTWLRGRGLRIDWLSLAGMVLAGVVLGTIWPLVIKIEWMRFDRHPYWYACTRVPLSLLSYFVLTTCTSDSPARAMAGTKIESGGAGCSGGRC